MHPGGRRVHPVFTGLTVVHPGASLGSLPCAGCRRDHPASVGSHKCSLEVVGFSRRLCGHSGAPLGSSGWSGVAEFTWVSPRGRLVHPGSLGSPGCALGVVGFIMRRWVDWGAP